jgi:hypothetical protein
MLGLHALWGGKPPGTSRIVKLGAWSSLKCVVAGSWDWLVRWGYTWGSKASRLESSSVHKAAEALGSTCFGALVSGAIAAIAGMGYPSLQPVRALRPVCWHQATRSHCNCCRHKGTKSLGSRSSGPDCRLWLQGVQCNGACWWLRGTKPAGLHFLLPLKQWELWSCLHGAPVSPMLQGEGSSSHSKSENGAPSSSVCQKAGLTAKHAE